MIPCEYQKDSVGDFRQYCRTADKSISRGNGNRGGRRSAVGHGATGGSGFMIVSLTVDE